MFVLRNDPELPYYPQWKKLSHLKGRISKITKENNHYEFLTNQENQLIESLKQVYIANDLEYLFKKRLQSMNDSFAFKKTWNDLPSSSKIRWTWGTVLLFMYPLVIILIPLLVSLL